MPSFRDSPDPCTSSVTTGEAGHVTEVAMARPDLLRSWVSDTIGGYEPDFVWHPLAQLWQTPGEGERSIGEIFAGDAGERGGAHGRMGHPRAGGR
ncbi:hypothetical protein GCM10020220_039040 [Nonomuraea rubra]